MMSKSDIKDVERRIEIKQQLIDLTIKEIVRLKMLLAFEEIESNKHKKVVE
jgi:hypothetical protein